MAFERTEMTAEEKIELAKLNIENPVWSGYVFNPPYRTIDIEEDIYLIWVGNEHWEPGDEIYFVFVWKGFVIVPLLRKKWEGPSTVSWDIIKLEIPKEAESYKNQIIDSLRDALKVYAFDGSPGAYNDEINNSVVVQFKF